MMSTMQMPSHFSEELTNSAPAYKSTSSKGDKSIIDTLKNDHRFSKLVSLLKEQQGLTDDLTSGKNITFFAPTNQAIESMEKDLGSLSGKREEMDKVLRYHCVEKKVQFKDLCDGQTLMSRLKIKQLDNNQQRIRVFRCCNTVALNMFSHVQEYDMEASNGVIHSIDRVLYLPVNIKDSLSMCPTNFSMWLLACERTGMDKTMMEKAGLTALIPTNGAWENLGYQTLAYLFACEHGEKDLKSIVEYHFAQKLTYADILIEKKKVELESMLKGERIEVQVEKMKSGEQCMNNWGRIEEKHHGEINPNCSRMILNRGESRIVFTDAVCENGNVFVISNVMIPENVNLGGRNNNDNERRR